jgi:hypothetical protein
MTENYRFIMVTESGISWPTKPKASPPEADLGSLHPDFPTVAMQPQKKYVIIQIIIAVVMQPYRCNKYLLVLKVALQQ